MRYQGTIINTEKDLLKFFYKMDRIRFLVGQSISWPYEDELVGRISFALEDEKLILAFSYMNRALLKLAQANHWMIRSNKLEDLEQMVMIKIKSNGSVNDRITSSKYSKTLSVEELKSRYQRSFEEYKDKILVAVRDGEVLGFSCFDTILNDQRYDVELLGLYVRCSETGNGIGSSLLIETCKAMLEHGHKNMIVWVFKEREKEIHFYEKMDGKIVEEKQILIHDHTFDIVGIYFDLERVVDRQF